MRSVSKALYWYESIEDLDDEEGDGSGLVITLPFFEI